MTTSKLLLPDSFYRMSLVIAILGFLLLLLPLSEAVAYRVDFDTDAAGNFILAGQVIDDEYAAWGIHISAENNKNDIDTAVAFDTSAPTGGDGDLITGTGAYGSGNDPDSPSLENVLILQENRGEPDDQGGTNAGIIRIDFDSLVTGGWITMLDIEEDNHELRFFDGGVDPFDIITIPALDDNSLQTIDLAGLTFSRLDVYFNGSGAIGEFEVTSVPEPATLLLIGIGLVGMAGLGRKKFKFN